MEMRECVEMRGVCGSEGSVCWESECWRDPLINSPSINKSKEEKPVVDAAKRIGVVKFLHAYVYVSVIPCFHLPSTYLSFFSQFHCLSLVQVELYSCLTD